MVTPVTKPTKPAVAKQGARGAHGRPARTSGRWSGAAAAPSGAAADDGLIWLFGIHAVRDALMNPHRRKARLLLTPNARLKLEEAMAVAEMEPEMQDPRRFAAPLDPNSVHQGAALAAEPLDWGALDQLCAPEPEPPAAAGAAAPIVVLLDRVTDPHNVGAILRSAEVFGARAVVAPRRHAAPETGALAKAASGALERQPYLRVVNLVRAMQSLRALGYTLVGLDGAAGATLAEAAARAPDGPVGVVLGAEGAGLRPSTQEACDLLARVPSATAFASLNVSNAAAVALYAFSPRGG